MFGAAPSRGWMSRAEGFPGCPEPSPQPLQIGTPPLRGPTRKELAGKRHHAQNIINDWKSNLKTTRKEPAGKRHHAAQKQTSQQSKPLGYILTPKWRPWLIPLC